MTVSADWGKFLDNKILQALAENGETRELGTRTICWRAHKDASAHWHITLEFRPAEYEHDEDAMLAEIARRGGPQADRNLVEGKTQPLGRVLDELEEEGSHN